MDDLVPVVRRLAWLCVLSAGPVVACKSAPPKPPVVVAAPEPPPAPPPPPKSCDTLDDECAAAADTRVPIQGSGWSLAPPPEWIYAHTPDALLAKTDAASIGVTVHETGKKKKAAAAARAQTLADVTQKLGLTAPKKKLVWPAKPAKSLSVGDAKVALYQFGGFSKMDKPGALLVFTTKLSETQSLLGVGFVLESDTHDADKAILACVESLRAEGPEKAPDAGASQ